MAHSPKELSIASMTATSADNILKTKIILLGDHGVGKTAFLANIIKVCGVDQRATQNVRQPFLSSGCTKRMSVMGREVDIILQDTAGQERYRSLTSSFYRKASGCLLFFNAHSQSSFDNLSSWLDDIDRYSSSEMPGIVLVGITNPLYFPPFGNHNNPTSMSSHMTNATASNNSNHRDDDDDDDDDDYARNSRNSSPYSSSPLFRNSFSRKFCHHKPLYEDDVVSNIQPQPSISSDSGISEDINKSQGTHSSKTHQNICINNNISDQEIRNSLLPKNNDECTRQENYNSIHETLDTFNLYKEKYSRGHISSAIHLPNDQNNENGAGDDSQTNKYQRVISKEQAQNFAYSRQIPYREVDLNGSQSSIDSILLRALDAILRKDKRCSFLLPGHEMPGALFLKPQGKDRSRCCFCLN